MISAVEQGREVAADSALDAADQAVQSYQKEMLFSQGTSGHEQLALVRLALKRLDEGTYGDCLHCGKTIGLKRLGSPSLDPLLHRVPGEDRKRRDRRSGRRCVSRPAAAEQRRGLSV